MRDSALTCILLLFLTCSSKLFPQPCPCKQATKNMVERLPSHLRDTSFRSFSDSQTLRPSYDIDYLYPKIRAPILPRQQRQSRFNLLPKLPPFDQLTPLDLDHPSLHPTFKQEVLDPFANTSQANLLPSPLVLSPVPLPLRPNRTTSMGSHPPLVRSQTTRTAASSIYSRSISTDELFSRHASPLSSMGDASHSGIAGDTTRLQAKPLTRPPTPHNQPKEQAARTPSRPESTPTMPPASFWTYARTVQEVQDPHHTARSTNNPFVCVDTSKPLPSYPSCHTKNVKSKTHAIEVAREEAGESPCYEKYRKGSGSPLWSGKSDFDRRLAAAMSETKISTSKSVHHREKTNAGKVSKSRWPSTAF